MTQLMLAVAYLGLDQKLKASNSLELAGLINRKLSDEPEVNKTNFVIVESELLDKIDSDEKNIKRWNQNIKDTFLQRLIMD